MMKTAKVSNKELEKVDKANEKKNEVQHECLLLKSELKELEKSTAEMKEKNKSYDKSQGKKKDAGEGLDKKEQELG